MAAKSDLSQGTLDLLILKVVALGPVHELVSGWGVVMELDVSFCGGTKEKALKNLKEAVRLFLEVNSSRLHRRSLKTHNAAVFAATLPSQVSSSLVRLFCLTVAPHRPISKSHITVRGTELGISLDFPVCQREGISKLLVCIIEAIEAPQ